MNIKKKIVSLSELCKIVSKLKKQGRTIAFTNGCFDILHFGHIHYLEKAKKKNRILIVGLNSDSSVRKIKGHKRPIVGQRQRAAVLSALACVDYVNLFSEKTPAKIIDAIKPDVLIKGADWKGKEVVGLSTVKSYGGKVELIRYLKQHSTSKLIASIQKRCRK